MRVELLYGPRHALAQDVMAVTNAAFMADTFFKKPEFHQRFDQETVMQMMNSPQSMFVTVISPDDVMVGSLYLHWSESTYETDQKEV